MTSPMRTPLARFFALLLLANAVESDSAIADTTPTVTYNFESPVFVSGQTTPLFNRAPNIGTADFRADFNSSPTTNGLFVSTLALSPLFSGQCLFDPFPPATADSLTITLNTPITAVQVDFALFSPDHLTLTSAAGTLSSSVFPSTQWGTLVFSSPTPFTEFTLQGFNSANQPTQLAIDNLVMTLVPEPSSFALLSMALSFLFLSRRRGHLRREWKNGMLE
jgi:hypothetical protein